MIEARDAAADRFSLRMSFPGALLLTALLSAPHPARAQTDTDARRAIDKCDRQSRGIKAALNSSLNANDHIVATISGSDSFCMGWSVLRVVRRWEDRRPVWFIQRIAAANYAPDLPTETTG